jgi:hypothetical protein
LFGDEFDSIPTSVQREVHLPNADGPSRYPDILLFFDDRALSIEVKKNDEHYEKTSHTAGLLERQYSTDWTHVLLLPRYKERVLEETFGDDLVDDESDGLYIDSSESAPIDVVYWEEVSLALRSVLRHGGSPDSHWEASAYPFCTLIEQKILQFVPVPTVEQVTNRTGVIHTSQSLSVVTGGIEEQIQYLENATETKE